MNEKKVVLITGGSSGIGKSIGHYLTQKGYMVYGTTRDLSKYPEFNEFELVALSVNDENSIRKAVDEVLKKSGRIDILINNAGMGITGALEETPFNEIDRVLDTNFKGPMRVINEVAPVMRKQKSGLIINITSVAGYMGLPYRGIYSATKSGLEMITETYRMEFKPFGIEVCALAPGDFATNIVAGRYHTAVDSNSPYHPQYELVLSQMNDHVKIGNDPIAVAKKVYKICKTKRPKAHYVVGTFLQKFSIKLKRILSDKAYERMLMNHYKL
jgi:NAD(P)-dependent dehydrogenase (short-subunit alcohol dehydrogenase family)